MNPPSPKTSALLADLRAKAAAGDRAAEWLYRILAHGDRAAQKKGHPS